MKYLMKPLTFHKQTQSVSNDKTQLPQLFARGELVPILLRQLTTYTLDSGYSGRITTHLRFSSPGLHRLLPAPVEPRLIVKVFETLIQPILRIGV